MTLPQIVVDMSLDKGHFKNGQAYVAFSCVISLDSLHIINHTWIKYMCQNVHEEMNFLNKQPLSLLPPPMVSMIDKSNNITIAHLNVNKLMAKQLDMQCEVTLLYSDIICMNETHLCEDDTINPDMLGFDD